MTNFEGSNVSSPSSIRVENNGSFQADNLNRITQVNLTSNSSNLSLLGLISYSGNNSASSLNGGLLDLSNLTTVANGVLSVSASGTGSVVNISSLLVVDEDTLNINQSNGGTVLRA